MLGRAMPRQSRTEHVDGSRFTTLTVQGSPLGTAWALEMAARARSEPHWRSKWLLEPASVPPGRSKWSLLKLWFNDLHIFRLSPKRWFKYLHQFQCLLKYEKSNICSRHHTDPKLASKQPKTYRDQLDTRLNPNSLHTDPNLSTTGSLDINCHLWIIMDVIVLYS
jgi:hypothetical protein